MVEEKTEEKKEDSSDGLLKTVERLEKANAEKKVLLEREEQLMAKKLLGGTTENPQPQAPKEETPAEYAKRVESGRV